MHLDIFLIGFFYYGVVMYRIGLPMWKLYARLGGALFCRADVAHDKDANVFIATSPDLKGLVVEAETIDTLFIETQDCINMLLAEQLDSKAQAHTLWHKDLHAPV